MKLSELKEAVDYATSRCREGEDPEVGIKTDNPNVGGSYKVSIYRAGLGSDWDAGYFVLSPSQGVVMYRTHDKAKSGYLLTIAKERLQALKDGYEKCGQKYIIKAREQEWIDGFIEGFERFSIEITTHGEK